MAAVSLESNKAKIAKRVIEVFEFIGAGQEPATVMYIARRYGRPQSSTSELLNSLVEMGLLYKDQRSRSFLPTARLAALGMSAQPDAIRDGRLFNYMDRLSQTTRKSVGLFGMVGTHVQVFRWVDGPQPVMDGVSCGISDLLTSSVAGRLLISTLGARQARGMLWRLNAEAPDTAKFDHAALVTDVLQYEHQLHATGPAGFFHDAQMSAVLLPRKDGERPLALGVIYGAEDAHEGDHLVQTMKHGLEQVISGNPDDYPPVNGSPIEFIRAV